MIEPKLRPRPTHGTGQPISPSLTHALRCINHMYGSDSIKPLSSMCPQRARVIPTGIPDLDNATGIGGIPVGRVVEIFGAEDSGKSALALHIASRLPTDRPALYVDADKHLSPAQIRANGLANNLYLLNLDTLEACRKAITGYGAIIIDTLTALPTRSQASMRLSDQEKFGATPQSKVLAHALPVLLPILAANGCTLIIVNQMRDRAGFVCGRRDHPTGGRALHHYAAMRLELHTMNYIYAGTPQPKVIGQEIRVRVVANKCAAADRCAGINLYYGLGLLARGAEGAG